jgi:uncharacterized protein (TIGR01244 family)
MVDPETIYHWYRLDDRITTSGQPTETELADIAALGVRCVINLGLHSHEKALRDEAATVHALGMTYVHIPVDFQNPTERDFDTFCTALNKASDSPVHVHCIANYRVSAFVYRYRRTILGMDEARARADLDRVWQPDPVWTEFIDRTPAKSVRRSRRSPGRPQGRQTTIGS